MSPEKEDKAKEEKRKRPWTSRLPEGLTSFLQTTGGIGNFTGRFFVELFRKPNEFKEALRQSYLLGYKTLLLVSITGFIMGFVLTLQSKPVLAQFGAEMWLPSMVSISIIRELGPVIASLICAGKIGSGIGAELGSMKVTEQIDAMEVSGANPFNYLVVTRVLATTITIPILVFYTDAIAVLGSFIATNIDLNMSFQLYLNLAFEMMVFSDIFPATIKTIFFGFAIGVVSCYMGFNAGKGTESVGQAANKAVVVSSLMIFLIDLAAVEVTKIFVDM